MGIDHRDSFNKVFKSGLSYILYLSVLEQISSLTIQMRDTE